MPSRAGESFIDSEIPDQSKSRQKKSRDPQTQLLFWAICIIRVTRSQMPRTKKQQTVEYESNYVPVEFVCPIMQAIMIEPVTLVCGHTFSDAALRAWMLFNESCPHGCDVGSEPLVNPHTSLKGRIQKFLELNPDSKHDCNSEFYVDQAVVRFFVRNNQEWSQNCGHVEESEMESDEHPKSDTSPEVERRSSSSKKRSNHRKGREADDQETSSETETESSNRLVRKRARVQLDIRKCIYRESTSNCQRQATHYALRDGMFEGNERCDSFKRALKFHLKSKTIDQSTYERLEQIFDIQDSDDENPQRPVRRKKLICGSHYAFPLFKIRQTMYPKIKFTKLTKDEYDRANAEFVKVRFCA
jgi:hypothetical protein